MYGIFSRGITMHTVIYGVRIWSCQPYNYIQCTCSILGGDFIKYSVIYGVNLQF